MKEKRPQILCVGHEPDLLELRCSILNQAGYDCRAANVEEAEAFLKPRKFDLVIVSARVSEEEKRRVTAFAHGTPLFFLNGVTFPRDLLKKVADLIASSIAGLSKPGA
jgi:DNA-binding response OmpR family regulator